MSNTKIASIKAESESLVHDVLVVGNGLVGGMLTYALGQAHMAIMVIDCDNPDHFADSRIGWSRHNCFPVELASVS